MHLLDAGDGAGRNQQKVVGKAHEPAAAHAAERGGDETQAFRLP